MVFACAVFMIMIYYSAILGWDGIYIILSFFKGWGADPNTFFTTTLLQSSETISGITTFIPLIAIAMLLGWVLIWFISHKDLEKGLGKVSKLLVPHQSDLSSFSAPTGHFWAISTFGWLHSDKSSSH